LNGTNGDTSPTAVALFLYHARGREFKDDRLGWTNRFTGAIAIRRAMLGVKECLAEMRIFTIVEANHEPGCRVNGRKSFSSGGFLPAISNSKGRTSSTNYSWVSGHVNTVCACQGIR
jgi:hypothetical protein